MSVIILDGNNFDEVINSGKPVIVDFFATWCGPCKMYAPMFSQIAEDNPDIVFATLDIDGAKDITTKYSIHTVPTLMSFKDGEVIKQHIGGLPEEDLLKLIETN